MRKALITIFVSADTDFSQSFPEISRVHCYSLSVWSCSCVSGHQWFMFRSDATSHSAPRLQVKLMGRSKKKKKITLILKELYKRTRWPGYQHENMFYSESNLDYGYSGKFFFLQLMSLSSNEENSEMIDNWGVFDFKWSCYI